MATLVYRTSTLPRLPAWAEERLRHYLDACGIPTATITSTSRTAEEQARVMVKGYGTPERASALYKGPKSAKVLAAWASNRTDPVPGMVAAMSSSGFVSSHMDPRWATFDLAPSSMPLSTVPSLLRYAQARLGTEVREVEGPPADNAVHLAFIPPVAP